MTMYEREEWAYIIFVMGCFIIALFFLMFC